MICVICGKGSVEEGARVLQGKAICAACVGELALGGGEDRPEGGEEGGAPEEIAAEGGLLQALEAELARVTMAPADLAPDDSFSVYREGKLFRITDGYSSAVAPAEKLLERLRMLADGAGEQAAWWVLADL